jgi:curli biogenesis system outer membrane secretion channel CsgG
MSCERRAPSARPAEANAALAPAACRSFSEHAVVEPRSRSCKPGASHAARSEGATVPHTTLARCAARHARVLGIALLAITPTVLAGNGPRATAAAPVPLGLALSAAAQGPQRAAALDQSAPAAHARPTLAVLKVAPTPSVQDAAMASGQLHDLAQIVDALDGQLIHALQSTRRFSVIARSDLDELLNEHDVQRLIGSDPARAFQMAGADYGLVLTLDDYRDQTAMMRSGLPGESDRIARANRVITISLVAKIYRVADGAVLESAAITHEIRKDLEYGTAPASAGIVERQFRDMLVAVAPELAGQATRAVLNRVFPARVLHVDNTQVTLSWGEGTTIAPGQVWRVMRTTLVEDYDFPGEYIEIEHEVARIRIVAVSPRTSTAAIVSGSGIERGNIARLDTGR